MTASSVDSEIVLTRTCCDACLAVMTLFFLFVKVTENKQQHHQRVRCAGSERSRMRPRLEESDDQHEHQKRTIEPSCGQVPSSTPRGHGEAQQEQTRAARNEHGRKPTPVRVTNSIEVHREFPCSRHRDNLRDSSSTVLDDACNEEIYKSKEGSRHERTMSASRGSRHARTRHNAKHDGDPVIDTTTTSGQLETMKSLHYASRLECRGWFPRETARHGQRSHTEEMVPQVSLTGRAVQPRHVEGAD